MNNFNKFVVGLKTKLKVKKMLKESKMYRNKIDSTNILDEYTNVITGQILDQIMDNQLSFNIQSLKKVNDNSNDSDD